MKKHSEWQRRVVIRLLKQETGRHFLDSGFAYGRHWERNASKTDDELIGDSVVMTVRPTHFELARPVGRWLVDGFSFDREHTNRLWAMSHRPERKDATWEDDFEEYITSLGGDIDYKNGSNTGNNENLLTQCVNIVPVDLPDRCGEYYGLRVHQGCDARGGYGQYVIAEMRDEAYNYSDANLGCNNGHRWYTDDSGYRWYSDESNATLKQDDFKIRSNKHTWWLACPECNCKLEAY